MKTLATITEYALPVVIWAVALGAFVLAACLRLT